MSYPPQMDHICDKNVQEDKNIVQQQASSEINKNCEKDPKQSGNTDLSISQTALIYAVENSLPPVKISCQPKFNRKRQGKENQISVCRHGEEFSTKK